jgi:hypothetical protein
MGTVTPMLRFAEWVKRRGFYIRTLDETPSIAMALRYEETLQQTARG